MILEGQVKKNRDGQDMLLKNILAIAGEDVSNKQLMKIFHDNLSRFTQATRPIETLK